MVHPSEIGTSSRSEDVDDETSASSASEDNMSEDGVAARQGLTKAHKEKHLSGFRITEDYLFSIDMHGAKNTAIATSNGDSAVANGSGFESVAEIEEENPLFPAYNTREELVRIMLQSLKSLGYQQAANTLEVESRISVESEPVRLFRSSVEIGKWAEVYDLLPALELSSGKSVSMVSLLIRKQQFLELLESGNAAEALSLLRNHISKLESVTPSELHSLSSLLMCSSPEELYLRADWDGSKGLSRLKLLKEIQRFVAPSVMLPDARLEELLLQALTWQRMTCLYHNSPDPSFSLLKDHNCKTNLIPSVAIHTFDKHTHEVWIVKFSHNGHYLASASRDKTAIIWDLKTRKIRHILKGQSDDVAHISWSPDDNYLITCVGKKFLLWQTSDGKLVNTFAKHTDNVSSCVWLPNHTQVVSAGHDQCVNLWNINGEAVHQWTGSRAVDMAVSTDSTFLAVACHDNCIRIYSLVEKTKEPIILRESDPITSICLTRNSRYALVNVLTTQELHLWDLVERRIIRTYVGHTQCHFILRSCFGGVNENLVVNGSEDSKIFIWHREYETVLQVLTGHTASVNSVDWHPRSPFIFASAADDYTIKIWGIPGAPNLLCPSL